MTEASVSTPTPANTSQADLDTWRILKRALRLALSDRGIEIDSADVALVTRFMFERIEASGLRMVPVKPTSGMQAAIKQALDDGKRLSVTWVKQKTKQRWRYQAAIDAAPDWRKGYQSDHGVADTETT